MLKAKCCLGTAHNKFMHTHLNSTSGIFIIGRRPWGQGMQNQLSTEQANRLLSPPIRLR